MGDTKFTAPLIPRERTTLSHADLQHEKLRTLEDELLKTSLEVVAGVSNFADLDPENINEVPEEWIKEMGKTAAVVRHRLAKVGWIPQKDAPVGVHAAVKVLTGIVRARATEKAGPRSLNVQLINWTSPSHDFDVPVVDIEE